MSSQKTSVKKLSQALSLPSRQSQKSQTPYPQKAGNVVANCLGLRTFRVVPIACHRMKRLLLLVLLAAAASASDLNNDVPAAVEIDDIEFVELEEIQKMLGLDPAEPVKILTEFDEDPGENDNEEFGTLLFDSMLIDPIEVHVDDVEESNLDGKLSSNLV
ncbi:unnamed protein product [Spodoptera exigua]|nr:unnamed protein product [Spodoptera exigua]